jgi:anti-sigma B factor antagonist
MSATPLVAIGPTSPRLGAARAPFRPRAPRRENDPSRVSMPSRDFDWLNTETKRLLDGTLVLAITGDVDLLTAPRLERELRIARESRAPAVILDLTACDFVDCAALSVLVRAKRLLDLAGTRFSLVVPPHLRRAFELTALDLELDLRPVRAAATPTLAVLGGAARLGRATFVPRWAAAGSSADRSTPDGPRGRSSG